MEQHLALWICGGSCERTYSDPRSSAAPALRGMLVPDSGCRHLTATSIFSHCPWLSCPHLTATPNFFQLQFNFNPNARSRTTSSSG